MLPILAAADNRQTQCANQLAGSTNRTSTSPDWDVACEHLWTRVRRATRPVDDSWQTMRRVWLISLVLFLATFAVFSRVLLADFVQWDDDLSVYQNPHIQGLDWVRLRWMFSDASYALRYEPLNWLSYALVYKLGGLKPFGYHLANLVLHCLNTVLLFVVLRRLLMEAGKAGYTGDRIELATSSAAVGALLWSLNPLRVEPVAHVTDLRYCLLLLSLLTSLWAYLRAHQSGSRGAAVRCSQILSVIAFGLSMLSLPFAFAYAAVLLAIDWYPLRRFGGGVLWWRDARVRDVLLEKIPFLLLGGLMLTTIATRLNPTGIWAELRVDRGLNIFERVMQAFYVWAYYLWKPWAPFHLSPFYTTLIDFNPNAWVFWLSATLVVGTSVLLVLKRSEWPWALALWTSYLVLVIPVLGLTERPHYTADRYAYVPSLVWAVAIAGLLQRLGARPRWRNSSLALGIAVAVFWAILSFHQVPVWRDSVALFEHVIRELGDDPNRGDIQWRLGSVYASQGRPQEAAQQYQASLRLQPTPVAHLCYAELLERDGDWQGALTNCRAALSLNPTPLNYVQAGQVLAALGHGAEAIQQYRQALALEPDLVPALNNLAWILAADAEASNRNGAEAVRLAERACALTDRQVPVVMGTLAASYAEAGRFKEAIAAAQQARALAQAAGQVDVAERNGELLKLYQSGQAFHEPLKPAGTATQGTP
jgi:protein O-mannosyl-transferase